MAITPALPAIVFLVLALGGILGGWLWRGALHKRYGKMTYLSIFRIDTLRRMKRLGWFELYETKDVSRLVFSKKPFRQGLYTGASGHGTADKPAEAAEFAEEWGKNARFCLTRRVLDGKILPLRQSTQLLLCAHK